MNSRVRFLLILLFLVLGVILHVQIGLTPAWYLYLAALIILITHFVFGNVWSAFAMMRKGKIKEAELLINQIKRPDLLTKQHKAYYHFIKGMIALQKEDLNDGELHLKQASEIGLRNANDNALVALNVSHIYYKQQKVNDCQLYLKKAKSFSPTDLMIREKISELEKILAGPYN